MAHHGRRAAGLALGLGLIAGIGAAEAADMALRGSIPAIGEVAEQPVNWGGLYGGLHFGVGSQQFDMQTAGRTEANRQLNGLNFESTGTGQTAASQLILIDPQRTSPMLFGGFVGYQVQFDDAVIGLEFDYTRLTRGQQAVGNFTSPNATMFTATTGAFTDAFRQNVTVTSRLDDYFTMRARAGYAFGRVMPYVTGGLAIGRGATTVNYIASYDRIDLNATDAVDWTANGVVLRNSTRASIGATSMGFTLGAGVEALLGQNVFLRAEYQYLRIPSMAGVPITMHAARIGAGLKY